MRRFVFYVVVAMVAIAAVAQPKAVWIETSHDFGTINENDGDASCCFALVNGGNEPLVILKARATCGCTTPVYSSDPIAPGDTALIEVSYDPVGRPGRFKKKIYIDTNTEPQRSTLTINGVVIASEHTVEARYPVNAGALRLRRPIVSLGEVYKGKAKTEFLDAYNISGDTIYPQWSGVPEYYSVMCAPKAVSPGEQVTFTFYLNSLKCDTWGRVADTIAVVSAPSAQPFKVLAVATVKEDFSRLTPGQRMKAPAIAVSRQHVDLGVISNTDGIITREIEVSNFGNEPLLLRRVYAYDDGVTVSVSKDKIKKGKSAKVSISVDTSKIGAELLNAHVIIISNDPERDKTVVRVTAEVRNT